MNQQGQLKASTSTLVSASSTRSASVSWKGSSTEAFCTRTTLMIHPFSHSAFVDIRSTEDRAGEKHSHHSHGNLQKTVCSGSRFQKVRVDDAAWRQGQEAEDSRTEPHT